MGDCRYVSLKHRDLRASEIDKPDRHANRLSDDHMGLIVTGSALSANMTNCRNTRNKANETIAEMQDMSHEFERHQRPTCHSSWFSGTWDDHHWVDWRGDIRPIFARGRSRYWFRYCEFIKGAVKYEVKFASVYNYTHIRDRLWTNWNVIQFTLSLWGQDHTNPPIWVYPAVQDLGIFTHNGMDTRSHRPNYELGLPIKATH